LYSCGSGLAVTPTSVYDELNFGQPYRLTRTTVMDFNPTGPGENAARGAMPANTLQGSKIIVGFQASGCKQVGSARLVSNLRAARYRSDVTQSDKLRRRQTWQDMVVQAQWRPSVSGS
jgi:hypothetical protein